LFFPILAIISKAVSFIPSPGEIYFVFTDVLGHFTDIPGFTAYWHYEMRSGVISFVKNYYPWQRSKTGILGSTDVTRDVNSGNREDGRAGNAIYSGEPPIARI
jgi:hypothetical protein